MASTARYRGVFPVAPTPFTEAGELDLASQKRCIDFMIDAGSQGICILANFSEQFVLADDERELLARTIIEHVAGRVPVIVTTTHFSSRLTIERSRRAQALGAAMVMVMPPYHGATIRVPEAAIVTNVEPDHLAHWGDFPALVAGFERDERVVVELVLLDLRSEQASRERGGVDRHARKLRQDVRQPADVVLVGVRDEECPHVRPALREVGDIGHDEIDAVHLLVGEHEAAIDDDDVVAVLEHVHVLADLPHPTEGNDAQCSGHQASCSNRVI